MKPHIPVQLYSKPILPPLEFLSIEIFYFVIVFAFCILIYFKTKDIYELTNHKGIKYFRQTFLYFSMAFLFRIMALIGLFSSIYGISSNVNIVKLSFFLVSYFSILAILSLTGSIMWKKIGDGLDSYNHITALLVSCIVFFGHFAPIIGLLGLSLFAFMGIKIYLNRKKKKISPFSKLSIVYFLLFIFWILNLAPLARLFFNPGLRISTYVFSIFTFILIFYKVNKRLSLNAKKKRTS